MSEADNFDPSLFAEEDANATGDAPDLEARIRRLEAIVQRLEGGELPLEEGLGLFEEGVRHIREAEQLLARAELRVEELVAEGQAGTESEGGAP